MGTSLWNEEGQEIRFDEYCKCLLKSIGATLMGVKPSELRSVRIYDQDEHKYWRKCKEILKEHSKIEIIEIGNADKRQKVFVYHISALDEQISKKKNLDFLRYLGYPKEYDLSKYVEYLLNEIEKNYFPHEIGIFFGYPLKDVLGFMGYLDLPVTTKAEWKVYGDKSISTIQQKKFNLARNAFNKRIQKINNLSCIHQLI
ncbi:MULTISPECIES: DUF3793 family protein [unclassified Candidatus Frackibacter]|uniref:DUF3793 family protein n=1 Tax=unclassified Candidatus Frackibacter TaxID=2648818 RepID=UPI0007932A54|nr:MULTISPECIES: DUF3793 family protein [unclassified Candidatus Frackibacter]KXS43542.1 MAG: hypothetical protein AWU54_1001 [Candidatus Frackibacter sp. T328-2]SDC53653.1 Protein of unknown function [Candidatus Frackibacter sp. WG11]SEM65990.1 Protein of unknown function [Candidatus Frackibacter sp. WG12]SFL77289.1 Protein of unknown function [Candidatus Frackibacter sp. WG13]